MAVMAMLMGLAIGLISPAGATLIKQSQSILEETARKCIGASVGNRRAVFQLRQLDDELGSPYLQVSGTIAQTVLTHNFETPTEASLGTIAEMEGTVKSISDGYVGNAAQFAGGGVLRFSAQPKFAMTEGFALDVWVRPEGGSQEMDIVVGDSSYRLSLVRPGKDERYDVKLSLLLRPVGADPRETAAQEVSFATKDAPVRVNGRWSHIEVEYDGRDVSLRVNGMERITTGRKKRTEGSVQLSELRRIAVPELGAVALSISSTRRPFTGAMDMLQLRGTFRSRELERRLAPELTIISPTLPVRVVYVNGQMDPTLHSAPVIMRFRDENEPDDLPLRLILGPYGTVEAGLGDAETSSRAKPRVSSSRKKEGS